MGIYHSSTHGRITISNMARVLLHALRGAVQDAIADKAFCTNDMALSKVRGDIAQHISTLESENERLLHVNKSIDEARDILGRELDEARSSVEALEKERFAHTSTKNELDKARAEVSATCCRGSSTSCAHRGRRSTRQLSH